MSKQSTRARYEQAFRVLVTAARRAGIDPTGWQLQEDEGACIRLYRGPGSDAGLCLTLGYLGVTMKGAAIAMEMLANGINAACDARTDHPSQETSS